MSFKRAVEWMLLGTAVVIALVLDGLLGLAVVSTLDDDGLIQTNLGFAVLSGLLGLLSVGAAGASAVLAVRSPRSVLGLPFIMALGGLGLSVVGLLLVAMSSI